jgi:hypothetical protein
MPICSGCSSHHTTSNPVEFRTPVDSNERSAAGWYYGLDRRETEPRQRERLPTASAVLSAKVFCPSDDLVIVRTDRVATKVCEAVCAVFYLW